MDIGHARLDMSISMFGFQDFFEQTLLSDRTDYPVPLTSFPQKRVNFEIFVSIFYILSFIR